MMTWGEGIRAVLGLFLELLLMTEEQGVKRSSRGWRGSASAHLILLASSLDAQRKLLRTCLTPDSSFPVLHTEANLPPGFLPDSPENSAPSPRICFHGSRTLFFQSLQLESWSPLGSHGP